MVEIKPNLEWARKALSSALWYFFSPSGHALTFQSLVRENALGCVEVRYADGREPTIFAPEYPECLIFPEGWLSEDEVLYYISGKPGPDRVPTRHALSISSGQTRLMTGWKGLQIVPHGKPGYFSLFQEVDGKQLLMEMDAATGKLHHRAEFDAALAGLAVYPGFGHAWSPVRQELAVIAWPTGDYLLEDVEPTRMNSQWTPILDSPRIQDCVITKADGSQITQRELSQEAKRQTPPRLFLLNTSGGCVEVPGTHHADNPLWSADGTLLSFERFIPQKDALPTNRLDGVWLTRRDDLSLMHLGACSLTPSPLMHSSGILFCRLEDERVLPDPTNRLWRRPSHWHTFAVQNDEIRPI